MFSFIHAADIHLDSPLRGLELPEDAPLDEIRGATRRAFDNLVSLAIEEKVAFVLLAGDLYDGDWKDFNTGLFFNKRMVKLKEAGIKVFMVSGNHDAASQISKSLRLPENVHVFSTRKPETQILEEIDVAIHGQSFAGRSVTDDLSRQYPQASDKYFNIGLLHTALSGREGHEPYAPCTVAGLTSKGYQYWALGHVHQREVVHEDPWIVFPGNIQGRHIRETGSKGCTLVTVDSGEVTRVDHIPLDVLCWQHCQVDVTGCQNVDEVLERSQARLEKALAEGDGRPVIARLELSGSTPAHQKLQAQSAHLTEECRNLALGLGGQSLWLEKVRFKTKEQIDLDAFIESDEALGGLVKNLLSLPLDAQSLAAIDPGIDAFLSKLPPELRGGDEPFDPADPDQWEEIRSDIKNLLIGQLLESGGAQ
ncbi:MAG: DNA repair exonuclease [Desulfuromonadales bacterium]|nr:DNA repair exonuclease [Desulfuromonadales bacterium]